MPSRRPLVITNGRRVQMPAGDTLDPEVLAVGLSNMPTIRPSLNLDFLNRDSLDARLAFSRNSIGTRVNAKGLIETVAANAPRFSHNPMNRQRLGLLIEESRTNLLTSSSNFLDSSWGSIRLIRIPNAAIAPDGTFTATKLVPTAEANTHVISKSASAVSGSTYTASLYVKAGEYPVIRIRAGDASYVGDILFNANTGVFTLISSSTVSYSSEQLPNGWWRICVAYTVPSNENTFGYGLWVYDATGLNATAAGDGSSGLYCWGAQLELGLFPTSYIPTDPVFTSRASTATYVDSVGKLVTAAANVPRYGYAYANGAYVSKGLLVEASATNLYTDSEAMGTGPNVTVSNDVITAPDGLMTADLVTEAAASGEHYIADRTAAMTAGQVYTFSAFVKAYKATAPRRLYLRIAANGNNFVGWFNPYDESASNCKFEKMADGWYRCWLTFTAAATASSVVRLQFLTLDNAGVYAGDVNAGLYMWGGQFETGSYPTSYIPTGSAVVTRSSDITSSSVVNRAADVVSLSLGSWFDSREGTILVAASKPEGSFSSNQFFFAIGTSTTRVLADYTNSGRSVGYHGNSEKLIAGAGALSSWRYALAYDATGATAMTLDGASPLAGAYTPAASTTLFVGQSYTSAPGPFGMHNGHIRQLCYYPKRLTNAELQGITA